jgi:type I restriction enzyme S subunit
MIADLKPYTEYKESGQEWLGQVPKHWGLQPGHAAFDKRKIPNTGLKENTVLSLSYGKIKVKPTDKQHGLVPESYETYQIVDEGNIIIRGTDLQNDKTSLRIGLSRNRGIISSAYLCLQCRDTVIPEYGYQILNTFDLTKAIYRYGSGLRQNLDHGEIKRLPIFLPPPTEQSAIVRFLDHWNARLEKAIRSKRRVIALLQEQKQAIIHRAVTRGLHPDVPLKPSGIPWLGDIPKNWEAKRIKYLLREVDNRSTTGLEPLLSMRMHHGLVVFSEHFTRPPQAATLVGFKIVRPRQFVVNRMQAGNGVIFPSCLSITGLVSPDYAVFDPIADVNVDYLGELFRSRTLRVKFRSESKGLGTGTSGFMRLYNDRFGAIHIPLPPREEQDSILKGIGEQSADLNTAIARTEREIALMQEYRTRLTADLVTGKLDVREAVVKLPDLPDEANAEPPLDEVEGELEPQEAEV